MQDGFPVHFSDGRTAGRISALLVLAPGRLEVHDGTGRLLAGWRYRDVRLQDAIRPGEPLRLSSTATPDARLTVLHPQAIDEVTRQLTAIGGSGYGMWRSLGWVVASGLAVAGVVWGLYAALPLAARPVARAIPVAWEEQLGDGMAVSALADQKICKGEDGQKALEGLLASIVTANGLERRFTLHVTADKTVNAFALPGGHIVLLSGLLNDARSPDEVAGVMAHEMAHILERHAAERLVRAAGVGLLLAWVTGDPSSLIAGAGGTLLNLSYSRGDESEADARGVSLLETAGLSTGGLSSFFLRLEEHHGKDSLVPQLLSTHPRATDRAAAHPGRDGRKPMTDAQWQSVKAMCR